MMLKQQVPEYFFFQSRYFFDATETGQQIFFSSFFQENLPIEIHHANHHASVVAGNIFMQRKNS
jgi:hypothetical protein